MKVNTLLFVLLSFTLFQLQAQTCLPGGITFTSQTEIDNFAADYPGCVEILGDMVIDGGISITDLSGLSQLNTLKQLDINNCKSLTSLSGLENISEVKGRLVLFKNDVINSLSGFSSLTNISGQFIMNKNHGLTDLSGLENLNQVGSFIQISANNGLVDLSGIGNIETIVGSFSVYNNPLLEGFTNFPNIEDMGGNIQINGNAKLTEINTFGDLEFLIGRIKIFDNPALTAIKGFDKLITISEELVIYGNPVLTDLSGLNTLVNLNGPVEIHNNASLASLIGIQNLDPSKILGLKLENSPMLSNCNVASICGYLEDGGTSTISGNASGCNSNGEIIAACDPNALDEFSLSNITVYPNPAHDLIQISGIDKNCSLTMYDMMGEIVLSKADFQGESISVESLNSGHYILRLILDEQEVNKFIQIN